MTTTLHTFPYNPGYLLHQCSELELAPIQQEVQAIADSQGRDYRPAHYDLVGVIDREYHLRECRDHVARLVLPLADRYIEHFHYEVKINRLGLEPRGLELGALWVNFQQPGEYNPIHQHDGLFSFVLWLSIPYTLEQERAVGPGSRQDYKPNGDFHFHYTDSLGAVKTHVMQADQSRQGQLCLFPAELHHVVYPYYSSRDLRISISGNLHLSWQSRQLEP